MSTLPPGGGQAYLPPVADLHRKRETKRKQKEALSIILASRRTPTTIPKLKIRPQEEEGEGGGGQMGRGGGKTGGFSTYLFIALITPAGKETRWKSEQMKPEHGKKK